MKKKKSVITLLFSAAVLTLASCGGSSAADTTTAAADGTTTSSDVTKTINLDEGGELMVYAPVGDTLLGFLQSAADRFTAQYPNWTVTFTTTTFSGSYDNVKDQVINDLNVGNQPAIAYCYPDHVAQYLKTGHVLNLNNYINDPTYGYTAEEWADFVPSYVAEGEAFSVEGRYTIPMARSSEVMFINKTAIEAAGMTVRDSYTWDTLFEDATALKSYYTASTPLGYDSSGNWLISYLEQMGAKDGTKYYTDGSKEGEQKILFNNDTLKSYLAQLKNYYNAGLFTTKDISSTNSSNNFKTWTAADASTFQGHFFSIGSTGGASYQLPNDDEDGNANFEVEIRAIPTVEGQAVKCISQGPSLVLLDQGSDAKNMATWLLTKEFLSVETQIDYSAQSGYSPVRYSVLTNEAYLTKLSQAAVSKKQTLINRVLTYANTLTENLYTSDVFVGSDTAREQMGTVMKEVMTTNSDDIAALIADTLDDAYNEVAFYVE